MTRPAHLTLIDGPLVDTQSLRHALIERMANDLILHKQAASRESAAIRTLHKTCGYAMADIIMCIDDVRNLAFSEIVAKEMSEP